VATFAIMPFNIVSGMLGENLKLPEEILDDTSRFTFVNIMSGIVSCSVFGAILWYMRKLKI
jgi:Mg2+ and Co2+ transporter CorA